MAGDIQEKLEKILGGDRIAAAWLYDTYAPTLYRRLRQRYGYPGGLDTDDLLQDSFVFYFQHEARVLRNFLQRVPPSQQTPKRLERHLWDMACGVATNRRRSKASSANVVPFSPADDVTLAPDAETSLIDQDLLDRLDRCLASGGERLYLYFKLRFGDGLTPDEITRVTGWSKKATYKLKQLLNKAVQKCANELGLDDSSEP